MRTLKKGLLGASVFSIFAASNAFAAGTLAGTNVQNTFTLDYQVSGVDQPTIDTSASGTNTPTEFTVDRLIDLTVASNGDTTVAPGATNEDLVFTLTNTGNDTQAYALTLTNATGDTLDLTTSGLTVTYYIEGGANPATLTPGVDDSAVIAYTTGNPTIDIAPDQQVWVVVTGDIPTDYLPGPTDVVDGDTIGIILTADTLEPTTAVGPLVPGDEVLADGDALNSLTGLAENVLADASGVSDAANAGDHSATGTYVVASADITAAKAVTIYSEGTTDPLCGAIPGTPPVTEQYSVPGSCVEYVITVVNTGATATATAIAMTDILPDELNYVNAVANNFTTTGTFTTPTIVGPATNLDCTGGACTVSLSGATLAAGATGTVTIRAVVK
jgi:uncharacterized repeat protein (TIGR01451 family)